LLERLRDHVEKDIPDEHVPLVIQSLLNIGDALIEPEDERGMFDLGNAFRASRLVYQLLKHVKVDKRIDILESAIQEGNAIAVQLYLLLKLYRELDKKNESTNDLLLTADNVDKIKISWLDKIRNLSGEASFLRHIELPTLLNAWRHWASEAEVRTWCEQITISDEGLLSFMQKFFQYTQSITSGERAVRLQPRLNPSHLKDYLDTTVCAERLRSLEQNGKIPAEAQEAVSQFLKEYEMLQSGINPDDRGVFDD
jgi:predicted KAP-like P-loop ATPase